MQLITNLIKDIYRVVGKEENWFTAERLAEFSSHVSMALTKDGQGRVPTLRLSKMGPCCPCQLWYSIHLPMAAEPIQPWAHIKFTYGHIVEALVIALAKSAGHEVTGEQDELIVDGIKGHRDCVIDGCLVDVKSCSSRMFEKFKNKSIGQDDPFGYLDQLDGYLVGSANDNLVRVKDKAYILAVDKTLGHLALYEHRLREQSILSRIQDYKRIVDLEEAPTCTCGTVPDGKSGNIKLDVKASYSPFKHKCFPHLRTFLYASGPVYLTKVVRKPDVTEINKYGQVIN